MAMVPAPQGALVFGAEASAENLVLPRVKVVQAMSAEAQDERAKPGDFFNTLTGESYGPEIRFMALQPFMQRVMLVRDERRDDINDALASAGLPVLNDGTKGLACRSRDMVHGVGTPGVECERCPLSQWRSDTEPPLCTETYNVAGMNELGDLIILSFAKSGAKAGRRFFSMLRLTPPHQRAWSRLYVAKTRKEKNDKGSFFIPDVTAAGEPPAPELVKWAGQWADNLRGVQVDVDLEEEETEAASTGTAPF